jgi:hypothetical protein
MHYGKKIPLFHFMSSVFIVFSSPLSICLLERGKDHNIEALG